MIKRYPCQVTVLLILGILAMKGIFVCQKEGAGTYGLFLSVPAAVSAWIFAKICIAREAPDRKKLRQALVLLLAFGTGMARMYAVSDTAERQLAGISDGQEVSLQGRVIKKQAKETQNQTQNQTIQWTVCCTDSYLKTSQGIRSCGDIMVFLGQNSGAPAIGNTIILSGKTKLFHEARNEGNFNERAYYQNQGYSLKIYADNAPFQTVDSSTDHLREWLYRLQQKLVQVYQSRMPGQEAGALCAMLLGEKSLLQPETKELYRQGGIAHILAISGLHISILGAAAFGLLRKRGMSYAVSSAVSMGLLALFGCMAGMGISTVRAVLMFGIYLGAACCGRAYDSANALAVAAACILLQEPRSLFLAGFQFSFAAVAGVFLGKETCRIYKPTYRLAETAFISLSIQMLTLPLTAWYYYEIPVYALLLNMLVLPFLGMVLVFGLLGGAFGLAAMGGMASGLAATGGMASGFVAAGGFAATGSMASGMAGIGSMGTGLPAFGMASGMAGVGSMGTGLPAFGMASGMGAGSSIGIGLAAACGKVSGGMLSVCTLLLGYFSKAGEWFSRLPGAVYITGQPGTWQMAGYYLLLAGGILVVGKMRQKQTVEVCQNRTGEMGQNKTVEVRQNPTGNTRQPQPDKNCKRAAAICFALCLGMLMLRLPRQAEVVILDVGQGDGIYIHTSDGLDVMIDGGSTDVKQAGEYRILPFLKARGIAGIDYWFVSHLDEDHISGFAQIAGSGYPIGEAVFSKDVPKDGAYEKMMGQLQECQIPARYLEKGDVLRGAHACFSCLSPQLVGQQDERNAKSLVLWYEDSGFCAFFSGDISQKEEKKLLAEGVPGRVGLYKAAHHGSKYSNTQELLAQLAPAVSVVSCSRDNDYGHPGQEAVTNMETYSQSVCYTMQSGQICILPQKNGLKIRKYLQGP